jgi:flagellar biosynthesis protein FlhA
MLAAGAIPGLPKFSFFLLAAGTGFLAWRAPQATRAAAAETAAAAKKKKSRTTRLDRRTAEARRAQPRSGLRPGAAGRPAQGGQLLAAGARCAESGAAAGLHGAVRCTSPTTCAQAAEYVIYLRGVESPAGSSTRTTCWPSARGAPAAAGRASPRGAGLRHGRQMDSPGLQNQALAKGYVVVDQTSVLATHLAEVVKQHAHELLTRQETKRLLDRWPRAIPSWSKNWCRAC